MGRQRIARWGWVAFTAAGLAAGACSLALPGARSVVAVSAGVAAALAILAGVRLNRPARTLPWHILAAGTALLAAGYLVDGVLDAPEPAPAVIRLAAFSALLAGAVTLVRPHRGERSVGTLIDAAIGIAALGGVQATLALVPLARADAPVSAHAGLALGYPVFDVLLIVALGRAGQSAWRFGACRLLALGFAAVFAGDELFALLMRGYGEGGALDAGWPVAYTLVGAAALHPSMTRLTCHRPAAAPWLIELRLGLLGFGLFVPLVLTALLGRGGHDDLALVADGAAIVVAALVLVRGAGLLRRSERLRLAERRARAEAEAARAGVLAQNHRLQSLDRMKDGVIAAVSHELRSPLTSIRGHLQLVSAQAGDRLDERQRRSLEVIDRSSERLTRMVEDVLLVARLRAGQIDLELDRIDLAEIARDCVEGARLAAAAKQVELELDVEPTPGDGDSVRLCQVVDNLISNAIKFSEPGGRVTVRVTGGVGSALLAVVDEGAGIPPTDRAQLFQPFSRGATAAARHTPGTGLGLHISKAIVDAHGGSIGLDSAVGRGTTVRVELPAAPRPVEVAA